MIGELVTEEELQYYLVYLNQAHFELYNYTALVNPLANRLHQLVNLLEGKSTDAIDLFKVTDVYLPDKNIPLKPTSFNTIIKKDPALKSTGTPYHWFTLNQFLYCYPRKTLQVGVWGVERPAMLTLTDTSDDIPYELSYQPLLIDGTSLLIYQNDTGMKNSAELKTTYERWHQGMRQFYAFLTSAYQHPISGYQGLC